MLLSALHGALDELAVWSEDRLPREPEACRLGEPLPLRCFGPLPPLPGTPPSTGTWSAPSPVPSHSGDRLSLRITPAAVPRRGTALLVPPWKIRGPELVSGYTGLLARAGWDAWLVAPPHHLERALAGRRSGEGFVTLDLARLRATFEQLVVELRACAALAGRRGPVGIVGLSLGALAAALAATAPEPLAFAALVSPPHLPLVAGTTGIGRRYRRLAALAGSPWPTEAELAASFAPLDPAARPPTTRDVFLACGRFDRISPVAGPLRLASAWGVEARAYARGHLSLLFLCRALRRDLAAFVASA